MEGKWNKRKACFRRNHSTMNHLITLRIIAKECHNNKYDLFCCFVDFRKTFDTMRRSNLWNILQELKVPFEFRDTTIRLYEKVIAKCKNNEQWLTDINCNIGVKQSWPLSPTFLAFTSIIQKLAQQKQVVPPRSWLGYLLSSCFMKMTLFLWEVVPLIQINNYEFSKISSLTWV